MKKILVIAAHPDDEILGCGATMAKHVKHGDEVHVLILAEGLTSRDVKRDRQKHESGFCELYEAAKRANDTLGVSSLTIHDFPDNRMDSLDLLDVTKVIEEYIAKIQPEIVYTHHSGDVNIDHRVIHQAVITACRPVPGHCVKTLLFFEVGSSTEWQPPNSAPYFTPNYFVNVTEEIALKLKALEAYAIEMREWPHPRSLRAQEYLARVRGASVGVKAAEAFMLGRSLY